MRGNTPLRAVVFDLDGTIIDTETPDYEAWREVYQRHGLDVSLDLWKQRVGFATIDGVSDVFDPQRHLERLTGKPLTAHEREAQHVRYLALCAAQPILPGVRELIEAVAARGIPLGLASNSDRPWVEHWLTHVRLRSYFTCVYTRDDVSKPKPAPDMYEAVVACLGLPAESCLAIEDSPTGMRSALSAGLRVVAVPGPLTIQLARPTVALTLTRLDEITPEALLAL
ncbi:MAG TPA: HAD family phosphatase [Aggregatilineales bacterium]|nr:HAD family phosphatase [Anaerolineales bacterium]HRE47972.1 HAD family phosphatase [Aggregatilineales bacterium]